MKRIVLEIDGQSYTVRGRHWRATQLDWERISAPFAAEYVISDLGSMPQVREACGKRSYCEYVLARDLRDEGELTGNHVLVVDKKYVVGREQCRVLFHVTNAERHRLRLQVLEETNNAAVLLSFGKVLARLAEANRGGSKVVVAMHHDVADVLLVRQGKVIDVHRVREASLPPAADVAALADRLGSAIAQLERRVGSEASEIVFHHLAIRADEEDAARALARTTTTGRGEPGTLAPLEPFRLDETLVQGSMYSALMKACARDACSARASKLRRWSMEKLGRAALLLVSANVACMMWWQHEREELALLDATHGALTIETAPAEAAESESVRLKEAIKRISPSLETLAAVERAARLPSVATAVAQLSNAAPSDALRIDELALSYPDAPTRGRTAGRVVPAGLRVSLTGTINAPALDAVGIYDQLVQRLEASGYALDEGTVDTALSEAEFSLALEYAGDS